MNDSIVGFWEYVLSWNNKRLGEYEFFSNGKFTYHNCQSGMRANGTYSVSGNSLVLSPANASPATFGIDLNGNNLTLTYNGDVLGYYKRR